MKYLLFLLAILVLPSVTLSENYLCVTEQSAGFTYDNSSKRWKAAILRSNSEYVLSRTDENNDEYRLKLSGIDNIDNKCDENFSEDGYIECYGILGIFNFNNKTTRFQFYYPYGYIEDTEIPGNKTPGIQIGTCSTF